MNLYKLITSYNIDFDLASIFIYLVIIISYSIRKHVRNTQHTFFLLLLGSSALTPVVDIFASLVIDLKAPWITVIVLNTIYYLSKQATNFFFLMYIISQIEMFDILPKRTKFFTLVPIGFITFLILLNPLTGWIFNYSNFEYHRGPLRSFTFIVAIIYYASGIIYVFTKKKDLAKPFRILIHIICYINIAFELIQLLGPSLLLHSLAVSISILILTMNQEYYEVDVNPITGIASKKHFSQECKRLLHNKVPFQVVILRMKDYDLNCSNYSLELVEEVIKQLGEKIFEFTNNNLVYKISTDTFGFLKTKHDIDPEISKKIYSLAHKPWIINGVDYVFEFYSSDFVYPANFVTGDTLLSLIQSIRTLNTNYHGVIPVTDLVIKDKARERKIEKAIENALTTTGLEVYYQPICSTDNNKFITAEALLRLTDPVLGKVSPAEFIPIAEQSGLILKIGDFVLEEVCRFIENHDFEELGLKYIEVNLSTIQCFQRNFINTIDRITKKHSVTPDKICFEITETASASAPTIFNKNLQLLNERGYNLALDDFGTGYGNIQRMVTSNFKFVKFDKNMTQKLSGESQLQKVYKTLQTVIHSMGSQVVTEGVETKDQLDFVTKAGCNYIQGYIFSKPLPENEFISFLKDHLIEK